MEDVGVTTIWKFEVQPADLFSVEMPRGAEVLSVQTQPDRSERLGVKAVMWARVDPDAPKERRRFAVHGTGHRVPADRGRFVGTFQLMNGELVFHLFEVP